MLFPLLSLVPLASATLLPFTPQHIFSNPPSHDEESALRIPTAYESAVLGRRVLALTPLGTLSTIFPSPHDGAEELEQRPSGLAGMPIGMMDYIADCEDSGNPTILAINIATSFRNAAAGSNISLSLQWTPPYPPSKRISLSSSEKEAVPYSAANLPRFSLLGYLEKVEDADTEGLKKCFVDTHPDSKYWLPGNRIHTSEWARFVVQDVYWVGGFGDRAYIGWIDAVDWKNVTKKEWEDVRLPGEKKGWKEWAADSLREWEL
ncbi:pyridoxamine 5'-phosphate oxidase-domain-containing protein [Amylocarpus encephaloides]|uniref:Pyridoxamine 5'-phosphate oxidase-domain-containing protein n=1 Tax=Amylocarpus encephaloides TaxID=45428 RepID=A0A9P8C9E7_9HELO|nr:pyridoxamine 5'-phosphate oxidase-domain-containing protein [Amylocarpus encephaloides]